MRERIIPLLVYVIAMSLPGIGWSQPDADTPFVEAPPTGGTAQARFDGATHRRMALEASGLSVAFPIVAPADAEGLRVTLLESTVGDPPLSNEGRFQIRLDPAVGGGKVIISAAPNRIRSGSHTLRARLDGPGLAPTVETLQISVPAPAVEMPSRLAVERVRPLIPSIFGDGEESYEPLLVRETEGAIGVRSVTVNQVGALRQGERGAVGRIAATGSVTNIEPGESRVIPYEVTPRHLPAGKVTGRLRLVASGLAEATEIEVEINSRVAPSWIIFLVFVGVSLGFLSRTLLAGWKERSEALVAAAAERRALDDAAGLAEDRQHIEGINALRARLAALVDGKQAREINSGLPEIADARALQVAALETRFAEIRGRLEATMSAASGGSMPDTVEVAFDALLDGVRERLSDRRTDAAEQMLSAGRELDALNKAWDRWRLETTASLGDVTELGGLIDVDGLAEAPDLVRSSSASTVLDEVTRGVEAFESVYAYVRAIWTETSEAVSAIAKALADVIEPDDKARLNALLADALDALVDGRAPAKALDVLAHRLVPAVREIIGEARPGRATIAQLEHGEYLEAATRRSRGVDVEQIDPDAMLDGRGEEGRRSVPTEVARWSRQLTVEPLSIVKSVAAPPREPSSPMLPKALASLVNAVIISLVGYALYAETFVGTGGEIVSVLLWAYGIDLGSDAVKAQIKQVTPSGKA